MTRSRAALAYRALFTFVGSFALALQYYLMISGSPDRGAAELALNFFSFFTILTNVMVFLAMVSPVVANAGAAGRWAASESVRAAVTMYAVMVGLVYHLLLHATWNPQGWLLLVNILLHYVMPLAMLVDWLAFTPKGRLRWIDAPRWLAVPAVYVVWTLIHGYASGWWPYWFVNVPALGVGRAAAWFVALMAFFLMTGLVLVAIDRALGRRDRMLAAA